MKNSLPNTAKVSKEAKECVQECVSEFISFIVSPPSIPPRLGSNADLLDLGGGGEVLA